MERDGLKRRLGSLTLANQLTFLRLVAVPFLILAVLDARFGLAFWIFAAAALTDALDGVIARWLRQQTALGAYLDPAADKLLLAAGFILLTEYPVLFRGIPMTQRIPIGLTVLTISRDVFIVAVALALYLAHGRRQFRPTTFGKLTTVSEIVTLGLVLLFNHLERRHGIVDLSIAATLALTIVSGLDYLWRTVAEIRAQGPEPGP